MGRRSMFISCHGIISPPASAHLREFWDGFRFILVRRNLWFLPVRIENWSLVVSESNSWRANWRDWICWFICLKGMVFLKKCCLRGTKAENSG